MGSEADAPGSRVFSEEEFEDTFGEAFDQPKENLGQSDDDDDDQPWRFVVGWRLRRGDASLPLPLDLSVKGCILEGWLLPRKPETRSIRVSLKNIDFVAFDREQQTRGWWVQTEPRRRKRLGAFYWLQEAADPDLHAQSRAVLALVSAILDVVSVNERAPSLPITVALGDWFATMAERGVDAKSVLVRFQDHVYTHVVRARPKLTASCPFLKSLTSLRQQKQRKVMQDLTQFCNFADEVSGRFPWGGQLRMKRYIDLPSNAFRSWVGSPRDQRTKDDLDDFDDDEEFELSSLPVVDSPTQKTAKRRKVRACGSSSHSSASGEQIVNRVHGEQKKETTGLVEGFEAGSSDSVVDSEKKRFKNTSTRRQPQTTVSVDRMNDASSKAKLADQPTASDSVRLTSRVEVFWPREKCYYSGVVDKIGKKRFHVHYDDGDEGWVDFDLDDYRLLEPPKRDSKTQSLSSTRVEKRESHNDVPPRSQSEVGDSGRVDAKFDVRSARVERSPQDVPEPSHKVKNNKAPILQRAVTGKKRKAENSIPDDQSAAIVTAKGRRKKKVSEAGSPSSPSDGIGDSADKPMVDTHDKKRNTLSRTTNVDNPGGRLSEKKKSSDPVDRKASIPIPSAHAASSDEMGDLLDVTKCKTTKVKTTQSCSTVFQETARSRTNESADVILHGVAKDGSHVPNEKTPSERESSVKRCVGKAIPESDIVRRDTSPDAGRSTAPPTKRHPTLLRIQLKPAVKSVPRSTGQVQNPKAHAHVCEASADGERSEAQQLPSTSELKPGTVDSLAQTRTDAEASYTAAAHLQENADGRKSGNPKDGKSSSASKSLARVMSHEGRCHSAPLVPEALKPVERSDSSKALPRVDAETGKRQVRPDADIDASDIPHSILRDEHEKESPYAAKTAKIRAEMDSTGTTKIAASATTKHAETVNARDSASVDGTNSWRVAGSRDAMGSILSRREREQSQLAAKLVSSQAKTNSTTKEVGSVLETEAARGLQRIKHPVVSAATVGAPNGGGSSVHVSRKAPRRSSSFKELVKKASQNAAPLAQSSLADLSDEEAFHDAPLHLGRHPQRLSQKGSISTVERSKPGSGDEEGAGAKDTDSNAHDAAAKKPFDETLVIDPESRKKHDRDRAPGRIAGILKNGRRGSGDAVGAGAKDAVSNARDTADEPFDARRKKHDKDQAPGRIAGILRNAIRPQPRPDSERDERVSDRNAVHSSRPRQELSECPNETDNEGGISLSVHRPGEAGLPGSTTSPTSPRVIRSLVAQSGVTFSSELPKRRDAIHESDSYTKQAKSTDPGTSKASVPPSKRESHAGAPPRHSVQLEPHRTQQSAALHSHTQSPHERSLPPRESFSGRNPAPGLGEGHERIIREPSRAGAGQGFARSEPGNASASTGSRHREQAAREYATARQNHSQESRRDWSQSNQRGSFGYADRSWNDANRRRDASSTNWTSGGEFQRRNANESQMRNVSRGMGFEGGNSYRAPGRAPYR